MAMASGQQRRVMAKRYLGDGVYVAPWAKCGGIILTTEDGIRTTNTIYLEDRVVQMLTEYLIEMEEERKADAAGY